MRKLLFLNLIVIKIHTFDQGNKNIPCGYWRYNLHQYYN